MRRERTDEWRKCSHCGHIGVLINMVTPYNDNETPYCVKCGYGDKIMVVPLRGALAVKEEESCRAQSD